MSYAIKQLPNATSIALSADLMRIYDDSAGEERQISMANVASSIAGESFGPYKVLWEWNGTDITEFDTKVDGSNVASSTVAFVSDYRGQSWISMSVTSDATATNMITCATILPISLAAFTPPSADYGIFAEYICVQWSDGSNATNGAGVWVRLDPASTGSGYGYRQKNMLGATSRMATFIASGGGSPSVSDGSAHYGSAASQGEGGALLYHHEGNVVQAGWLGERYRFSDSGATTTAANQGAIFTSVESIASQTVVNYFRNIKAIQLQA
jgi:hypothetical protein